MTSLEQNHLANPDGPAPRSGANGLLEAISDLQIHQLEQERRALTRHPVQLPATVIPLDKDGHPVLEEKQQAVFRDINTQGASVNLLDSIPPKAREILIAVKSSDGSTRFTSVEILHGRSNGDGRWLTGGPFGGVIQSILNKDCIVPTFQPQSMEFVYEHSEPLLKMLSKIGVIRKTVLDHVQLCPHCQGLPTFRQGCRGCMSGNVVSDRFIHHFACAYVGPVSEFRSPEGLICPKCLAKNPVVGADFEYLTGQFHCLSCGESHSELEQAGRCLRCGFRFKGDQSIVEEIIGFHVHRLDPLDIITTS